MTLFSKIKNLFPSAKDPNDKETFGDSILNKSFIQLVDYVECVIAQIYKITADISHRNKQDGLNGIDWLKSQNEKDPAYQSALDEIRILYTWWTDLRTKRTNPWDGISESYGDFKDEWLNTTEDKDAEYKKFMDQCRHAEKMQDLYSTEDTKMLVRLVTIRKYL